VLETLIAPSVPGKPATPQIPTWERDFNPALLLFFGRRGWGMRARFYKSVRSIAKATVQTVLVAD